MQKALGSAGTAAPTLAHLWGAFPDARSLMWGFRATLLHLYDGGAADVQERLAFGRHR